MIRSWVNGREASTVSIQDRALGYGDGLFETVKISGGRLEYWPQHRQRLLTGVARLALKLDMAQLDAEISAFCAGVEEGVLKLIVSRGEGGRGYFYPDNMQANRMLMLYPAVHYPDAYYRQGVRVRFCRIRALQNPALAGIKHLNRLEQVLARNEWQDEVEEGLLLDQNDHALEGTMSNLFAIKNGQLLTPDLSGNGVSGIIRGMILQHAERENIRCRITDLSRQQLEQADELFLCNSIIGIWPVRDLDGNQYQAPGPITREWMDWLNNNKQEQ
jgi:4-amino-4-deoxychorismate lyase